MFDDFSAAYLREKPDATVATAAWSSDVNEVVYSGQIISFEVTQGKDFDVFVRNAVIGVETAGGLVTLEFYNLSEVKASFSFHRCSDVKVSDLRGNGWEGQTISVEEIGDNEFSFFCDSYTVTTQELR